jgi:transposase
MKIIEILRLWEQGYSQREIAASVKCAKSTVGVIQQKCRECGLRYEEAAGMTHESILAKLYPDGSGGRQYRDDPDFLRIQKALDSRKRANLQYVWEEYRMETPEGLSYSQFCSRYRRWRNASGKDVVMVQEREAGKELFVDWMGDTLECVRDSETGRLLKAHFFVATVGDSGYPYAEAFPNEKIASWVTAHGHAFSHLGGVPQMIIPDNCRTAVKKSNYYNPAINRSYEEMAVYYQVAVIPARVRHPKDKAQVEGAVGWLEQWLLEWLRVQGDFDSFQALNQAVKERMAVLVQRPFQKRAGSRESVFFEIDKPALRPLPPFPYEIAEYQNRRVPDNYHLELEQFYYSVPHEYYKQEVTMRITASMIEVYDRSNKRIALHMRRYTGPRYSTCKEHMPEQHRYKALYDRFDGQRYRSWASSIGEHTYGVIDTVLLQAGIQEKAYRSCMGILQLAKKYGNSRLEAACKRAQELSSPCYTTVYNVLKNRQELTPQGELFEPVAAHENLRGADSFE